MTIDSIHRSRFRRKKKAEADEEDRAFLQMTDFELRNEANIAAESLRELFQDATRDELVDYVLALKRMEILLRKPEAARRLKASEREEQPRKAGLARGSRVRKDWKRLERVACRIYRSFPDPTKRGTRAQFEREIGKHLEVGSANCIRNVKTATNGLWPWLTGRAKFPPSESPRRSRT